MGWEDRVLEWQGKDSSSSILPGSKLLGVYRVLGFAAVLRPVPGLSKSVFGLASMASFLLRRVSLRVSWLKFLFR